MYPLELQPRPDVDDATISTNSAISAHVNEEAPTNTNPTNSAEDFIHIYKRERFSST